MGGLLRPVEASQVRDGQGQSTVLESRTAAASEAISIDVPQGTVSDWALGPPETSAELCEAQPTHALSCRDYS